MAANNVSPDLVWQITNGHASYLHKSKMSGGVVFSRSALNLTNKHSRRWEGNVNDKAIGVNPGEKGGVEVTIKKKGKNHQPGSSFGHTTFASKTGPRKTYKAVAAASARQAYRPDLREAAVQRTSAIKQSQRVKKDTPARKERGNKAKKAQAAA